MQHMRVHACGRPLRHARLVSDAPPGPRVTVTHRQASHIPPGAAAGPLEVPSIEISRHGEITPDAGSRPMGARRPAGGPVEEQQIQDAGPANEAASSGERIIAESLTRQTTPSSPNCWPGAGLYDVESRSHDQLSLGGDPTPAQHDG